MVPNARVTIMRGTYQDDYDDTHDSTRPVAVRVPISLVEMTDTYASPETGRSYDVMYWQGYVKPNVSIRQGDRLMNEADKSIYLVDSVSRDHGVFMASDKKLKLRLIED